MIELLLPLLHDHLPEIARHVVQSIVIKLIRRGITKLVNHINRPKELHREYWSLRARMHPNQVCRATLETDTLARKAMVARDIKKLEQYIQSLPS